MITKEQYTKQVNEISKNYPTTNWDNFEDRWLYHEQTIKWLEGLKPKTVLEIGGLGIKIREDSKTLDNGKWKIDHNVDYLQDVKELDIPDFDCIIALRVLHHVPEDFERVLGELLNKSKHLMVALPKDFPVKGYSEAVRCKDSTVYLWK